MNKCLALLIEYMALAEFHTKKSKDPQFFKGSKEYPKAGDAEAFYPVPVIPDIRIDTTESAGDYNKGMYYYDSLIKTGYDVNDVSSGICYQNITSDRSPNIIVIHGFKLEKMDWIENLVEDNLLKNGYNIYYYTLPYHFQRAPETSLYSGEYMMSANIDRTLQSVNQAVTDVRMLLRWIRQNREGGIALVGISFGGIISNLVATLDHCFDSLVSVFYANSIAYSVWNSIPGRYAKKEFEKNMITFEMLKKYWEVTDPSNFKPLIRKDNILLLSGRYDRFILEEDSNALWEAWDKPKRIYFPCGHTGVVMERKIIGDEIITFLNNKTGK